ncbi:MAG: FRG domain-containing protein, partial [Crenarchaeota archaeon]|nr:FRG domain-containing protein [Thermoproteota archaeon]
MMKTTIVESFSDYMNYTEPYKNRFYFRGQSNSSWNVTPSLFRENRPLITIEEECEMVRKEMETTGLSALSALFRLQHYGTATRICDLTISPMSALFFATSSELQKDKDGVIYVFDKSKSVELTTQNVEIISQVYMQKQEHLSSFLKDIIDNDLIEKLTGNHIIRYDYRFSYTNQRAILQGGTGLIFGFGFKNEELTQYNCLDVSNLIAEKIIIPARIKEQMVKKLYQIGYSKDILYGQLENSRNDENLNLIVTKENLGKRGEFNKYVASYKVSALCYNLDDLIEEIKNIYEQLFIKIGANARVWLYFYYDDEDIKHANWICRTEWTESFPHYKIRWTKDYYKERLRNINEQASIKEVISSFSDLLNELMPLYQDIKQSVEKNKSLNHAILVIQKHKQQIARISKKANNIPFCVTEIDVLAEKALSFINNVDWLVG